MKKIIVLFISLIAAWADGQTVPSAYFINISVLTATGTGEDGTAIGFSIVAGPNYNPNDATHAKMRVLIRGVGPTLSQFGVSFPCATPVLTVYDSTSTAIATNSGWDGTAATAAIMASVGAFALPVGSKDTVEVLDLAPGTYTSTVNTSKFDGYVLFEVYAVSNDPNYYRLGNISNRQGITQQAGGGMTIGFVVGGSGTRKVLLRGIGVGLKQFGINDFAASPILTLYSQNGSLLGSDQNWSSGSATTTAALKTAFVATGAFALNMGSADAAMEYVLPGPGNYTTEINTPVGSGVALFEAYEDPTP